MNKDYQEHELTAFLLDELDDNRCAEIAEILKNSESARQQLEEIQDAMQGVCEVFTDEPAIALTSEQRRELHAEFAGSRKVAFGVGIIKGWSSRVRPIRWSMPVAVAASLIVVFALSWNLVNRSPAVSPAGQEVEQQLSRVDRDQESRKEKPAAPAMEEVRERQALSSEARERQALSKAEEAYRHSAPKDLPRAPQPPAAQTTSRASRLASAVPAFKGKVTDETGAPLPGASVRVASGGAKPVQSTLTDTRGQFAVPPLPQGEYRIQASMPGFRSGQVGPVRAEEGKTREVQLALQVGEVAQTVVTNQAEAYKRLAAPPPATVPAPAKDEKFFGFSGVPAGVAGGVISARTKSGVQESYSSIPMPEEEPFNTESYDYQADNEMTAVAKDPLSTFSIDVDTASYSNVRRFLREGRLPPPDAVRIEEMINYFPYDYEPPHDRSPFAVATEVSQAPWAPDHRLVRVALKGRELPPTERPEANLVFLLDVSGSMQSAVKLPLVKQAMRLLVDKLENTDRVSIVVYAGASGLVLQSTPGSDKQRILDAIDQLEAGGSTHASAGIQLAYREALANFKANGINRVILATDGDFNVGITNQGELVRIIQQQAAKGVYLTALGFGMGNYKDSMLEKLADKGNGNYAYIDSLNEARKVLVEQMGGTLVTIAKDVKIQVEFNPREVTAYRLIGYENRVMAHQDFDDDRKDAGEIGAGHTVTALYEVVPVGVPVDLPQGEPLKYQRKTPAAATQGELLTVKLRYKLPKEETSRKLEVPVADSMQVFNQASDDFRFAAAVAGFGMILRNSPFKGTATFQTMMQIADTSRQFDPQGYRAEFVRLVGEASRLAGGR